MIGALTSKELRSVIFSPRFPAVFGVCSVLVILSVLVGILEYNACVRDNQAGQQLVNQYWSQATDWLNVGNSVYRRPDPLQIFSSGVTFDLGRAAQIDRFIVPHLRSSTTMIDPIFAVFRYLDFSLIVVVVLSLLGVVLAHDAITGERESGTLRLVFSNSVSRAQYLTAKCLGIWLGLVVPLGIPILISILLTQVFGIEFAGVDWFRLGMLLVSAFLLVSFFVVFGVLISTLTKRSSVSFLLCLTGWVLIVFVFPRIAAVCANSVVSVPPTGTVMSQKMAYLRDQWAVHSDGMNARFDEYRRKWDPRDQSFDRKWREAESDLRDKVNNRIWTFEANLYQDQRNAQLQEEHYTNLFCRFSPASIFQLTAARLANTDTGLKHRYEDPLAEYSVTFRDYITQKNKTDLPKEANQTVTIPIGQNRSIGVTAPGSTIPLDLSDMPSFQHPEWPANVMVKQLAIEIGLLLCYILVAFAAAWMAFLRYDLR